MATDCEVLGGDDQVINERYSHWYTIQKSLVWQQMLGSADDGMTNLLAMTGMKTSKSQVSIVDPLQLVDTVFVLVHTAPMRSNP